MDNNGKCTDYQNYGFGAGIIKMIEIAGLLLAIGLFVICRRGGFLKRQLNRYGELKNDDDAASHEYYQYARDLQEHVSKCETCNKDY